MSAHEPDIVSLGVPSAAPLASYPILIDLRQEQARETADFRSRQQPFFLIYSGLGFAFIALGALFALGFFGGNLVGGVATAVVGAAFAVLMIFLSRWLVGREPVRLDLTETSLEFVRAKGSSLRLDWSDLNLKFNLARFDGDPKGVLPEKDARRGRPEWVDVWQPPSRFVKLETTLPEGATATILSEAQRRGLTVTPIRVAFWWHSAPKSPGWLDYDVEGALKGKHLLNGRIVRVRGPAWKGVSEAH